jgi:Translationally controlled tumour protein
VKRVEEKNPGELDKFKKNVQEAVKKILAKHSDLQFFTGRSSVDQDYLISSAILFTAWHGGKI